MGQKINPNGFRVGIIKDWDSRWMVKKNQMSDCIVEDHKIRTFLKEKLYAAGVSKIEIERAANKISVNIYTAKPGIVIGKGGTGLDVIKADLKKLTDKTVVINVMEVRRPDVDAQLVAENVASQLERRIAFRRAMKSCIGRAMKGGVKGIKIATGGRLGGAEIARSESYHEGSIPLQTIRADIDYGFAEANTTYGKIGVKVWIYNGEIMVNPLKERAKNTNAPRENRRDKIRNPEGGRRNVTSKKSKA